ncbi:hypothetical protein [Azospirillum sp. Sh1]|uniref:hypothetical protein n=1 Tax=Azospirillum sp. Sh1 TaxID=2607285 RepID=UPI0011EDF007|nr:hypothetical protein [Azospirillum sp. Sh1]KAA0582710.1 hypothetical protein FZ029_01040 [Azospirillum sp. Sh1]
MALPLELAAQIERFRESRSLQSESDALRRLVEIGLGSIDTPNDLANRCADATSAGNSINYVIANILEDHPLIRSININNETVEIYLHGDQEIHFDKLTKKWLLNRRDLIPF